ncbi:MAG: glycosyltransferase [Bacteroidaceae bacterium]|nr:glycosyltransferase [Bacteroidaceae bacterium]
MYKKLVFLADSLHYNDYTRRIFYQRINWLAENSEYKIYLILTEKNKKPIRNELSSKVEVINLDINYEKLRKENTIKRMVLYTKKLYLHRKRLTQLLRKIRPIATISTMEKELCFLSSIKGGGQKIYEIYHSKYDYIKPANRKPSAFISTLPIRLRLMYLKLMIGKHGILVVNSERMKHEWSKGFKRIVSIPNPLEHYPILREKCESQKVIAIGDYASDSGFDHVIDMWERITKKYPEWRLHLYGNGNIESYKEIVKKNHMSRSIQCYDYPNNLREIYPKYAIFIQTCKFDKLGQHLMEAMSFSLPCVAYDVAYGPQDLISDERNGFLIKPNHLVDFASKVGLLIRNEELRYNMGRNAHASIHKFEQSEIMKEWINLYASAYSHK